MVAMASEVQELASKSGGETSQVEKAESQAKAANEKYLRLNADFDNFRKRSVSFWCCSRSMKRLYLNLSASPT